MALAIMDARMPFDCNDLADIILQSSDNVHFYVHSAFLSFVSPSFKDMFSLNQGLAVNENEKKDGLPIISITEDSETLYFLLERIYPIDESPFNDLIVFRKVCKAAQKYLMDRIENKLRRYILTSQLLKNGPFRMYTIAIDLCWEAVALTAARATLQIPLEKLPFISELKDISGSEFYRYLDFRFRCDKSSDSSKEELARLTRNTTGFQPDATQGNPPARAPEPFNTSANGNLIFRSSDSVDFFVIEGLIRLVSPFFDGMFPLQEHEEINGRAIINLSEDSRVLHGLLSIIYPHADEPVMDYYIWKQIVQAARKYKISIVEKKLRKLGTTLVEKEPLRMYVIAMSLGWEEVANMAALNTFSQPLQDMKFVEEMNQITGADLYSLMRYRFTCAKVACKVANDSSIHTKHGYGNLASLLNSGYDSGCGYCGYGGYKKGMRAYQIKKSDASSTNTEKGCYASLTPDTSGEVNKLLKNCPRGATYKSIYASEFTRLAGLSDNAPSHQLSVVNTVVAYRDGLATAIEEAISKVGSLFCFAHIPRSSAQVLNTCFVMHLLEPIALPRKAY